MTERDELWLAGERPPGLKLDRDALVVYLLVPLFLTVVSVEGGGPWRWINQYAINFIVGACIAGSMSAVYAYVWPRVLRRRPGGLGRLAAHGLTCLFGAFVGSELAVWLAALIWDVDIPRARERVRVVGLLMSTSVVTLLVVIDRLRARAQRSERAAQAARVAAMQAQLDALVARTNPHFLFNSLNSVAALIPEDAARAEAMLERLATLFRYALEGARRREVALAEELAIARDYLEIEGIRLGERLRSTVAVEGEVGDVAVPPLSLQPLVENAIVHGIAPRRGPGRVDVRVVRHGDRIELTVDDDGDGAANSAGSRSALADLRARLALLHGDAASLDAGPRDGGGWRARISLPARPVGAEAP